jgi:hypothetical protein
MEKPPMEWIDNLFNCMKEFYGTRWTKRFNKFMTENIVKTMWQSGLQGLTYEEIRHVLIRLKQSSKNYNSLPPSYMEFCNLAKNSAPLKMEPKKPSASKYNPEVAKRYLDEINAKIRYRQVAEEGAKVS